MEFFNGSIQFHFSIDTEKLSEAVAQQVASATYRLTKAITDRAIADNQQVISWGRAARARVDAQAQLVLCH
jgi:hypothetical protein